MLAEMARGLEVRKRGLSLRVPVRVDLGRKASFGVSLGILSGTFRYEWR